jgi:hypothetical protein
MAACFERISSNLDVRVEHDIRYGYARMCEPYRYPTVEEFFVVAPATVESKTQNRTQKFGGRSPAFRVPAVGPREIGKPPLSLG